MTFFSKIIGKNPIILLNLHMDLSQSIRNLSSQPLTHQLLISLLKDYKRPNDKILRDTASRGWERSECTYRVPRESFI